MRRRLPLRVRAAAAAPLLLAASGTWIDLPGVVAVPVPRPATELASVSSSGASADGRSIAPRFSADGRYVAFSSDATDLVPGDTNGVGDVFVRDLRFHRTTRVSLSSRGVQANGPSFIDTISADGRYVLFTSSATNLAGEGTAVNVFIRDRWAGTTSLVSVSSSGVPGNATSLWASVSPDGRYVAFQSFATNLVPGDRNGVGDVFLRDRELGVTRLVSVAGDGAQGNDNSVGSSISADGRFVAFKSFSDNFAPGDANHDSDVFVRDVVAGTTELVSASVPGAPAGGASATPSISADGRYVTFDSFAPDLVPGDTNGDGDVFVRDRRAGTTSRISVSTEGAQGNGRSGGESFRIGQMLNADGRYVAFSSAASNLVPGDTNGVEDVFLRDRATGRTARVSLSAAGDQLTGDPLVDSLAISGDGRFVGFSSEAAGLVPGDVNGLEDVFVRAAGRPFRSGP